jgi:hypothetical protein
MYFSTVYSKRKFANFKIAPNFIFTTKLLDLVLIPNISVYQNLDSDPIFKKFPNQYLLKKCKIILTIF